MKNFTNSQVAIKKAIERDFHEFHLQQSTLIPLLLSNRQIDKILRISWRDRCALQEHSIIPITWGRRLFYFSPVDIPDLFTSNNDHY